MWKKITSINILEHKINFVCLGGFNSVSDVTVYNVLKNMLIWPCCFGVNFVMYTAQFQSTSTPKSKNNFAVCFLSWKQTLELWWHVKGWIKHLLLNLQVIRISVVFSGGPGAEKTAPIHPQGVIAKATRCTGDETFIIMWQQWKKVSQKKWEIYASVFEIELQILVHVFTQKT